MVIDLLIMVVMIDDDGNKNVYLIASLSYGYISPKLTNEPHPTTKNNNNNNNYSI